MGSVFVGPVREKIQVAMGDLTRTFIEDTDVYGWIFDACQEIAKITECLTKEYNTLTVADQEFYVIDHSILRIVRVTYDGRKLDRISLNMLDSIDPHRDKAGNSGVPTHYYMDGSELGLWKRPQSSDAALKVRARVLPTQLIENDFNVLEIPDIYQTNIIGYCVIQARHKDEAPEMMMMLMEGWKNSLATAKNIMDNPESSYASVTDIESMVDYTTDWYS